MDRWLYPSLGLATLLLVVAGFAPSAVDSSKRLAPLTPLVIVHGVVFAAWLLLFVAQARLGAARRISVHRRVGAIGAPLAATMVVVGYVTSIQMARRGFDLSGDLGGAAADVPALLALQLGDLGAFTMLATAGLWFRRRPEVHKRLMLLATVSPTTLMGAPLAHVAGHWPALGLVTLLIALLLQFSAPLCDRVLHGRVHPVSLWGSITLFVWSMVRGLVIIPSAQWRRLAAWLIG